MDNHWTKFRHGQSQDNTWIYDVRAMGKGLWPTATMPTQGPLAYIGQSLDFDKQWTNRPAAYADYGKGTNGPAAIIV